MQVQQNKTAAQQAQRTKLANSYGQLLAEFSSPELRSVGNYTLGRLIGKGSFGKVYLATHKLTNGSKARTLSRPWKMHADHAQRSCSSRRGRRMRTSRERSTITASSSTHISQDYTRS